MSAASSPKILSASTKYRWFVILLFLGMLLLGWVFLMLTESYISELQNLAQHSPEQALGKSSFLFLFITMMAGLPTVGMGAYMIYQGNQIRMSRQFPAPGTRVIVSTPVMEGSRAVLRGRLLLLLGVVVLACGFGLPLFAWWLISAL